MSPIRDLNLYILVKENICNPLSHEGTPSSLRISPIGHKDIISSLKRMKNELMTEMFQVQHMLHVWDLKSYILVKAFFQPFKWKKFHQQHFSEKILFLVMFVGCLTWLHEPRHERGWDHNRSEYQQHRWLVYPQLENVDTEWGEFSAPPCFCCCSTAKTNFEVSHGSAWGLLCYMGNISMCKDYSYAS